MVLTIKKRPRGKYLKKRLGQDNGKSETRMEDNRYQRMKESPKYIGDRK